MRSLFVDAGAWIALFNARDSHHGRARVFHVEQNAHKRPLITTNYVIAEAATRLRYDGGLRAAIGLRDGIDALVGAGRLRIRWGDRRLQREAWAVMERYADIGLSFADAASVAVARAERVREVFGFDSQFRALGFELQPA